MAWIQRMMEAVANRIVDLADGALTRTRWCG
jgi:hypothetical protein